MRALLSFLTLAALPALAQPAPALRLTLGPVPGFEGAANFGRALDAGQDLDGDGTPDLVVGANAIDRIFTHSGATGALLHSIPGGSCTSDFSCGFGSYVVFVADATGDGVADITVGSPADDGPNGEEAAGSVYLYSGATGVRRWREADPDPEEFGAFGSVLAAAGDINSDGAGDIAVGGSIYHWLALLSGDNGGTPIRLVPGRGTYSVALVGDLTADGRPDLAVGARSAVPPNDQFVYLYDAVNDVYLDTLASPTGPSSDFGADPADAGDLDGDGVNEIVVGAPGASGDGLPGAGRAYVFSGATSEVLFTLARPDPDENGNYGTPLAAGTDVDNDGVPDIAVGAYTDDPGDAPSAAGRVYVFSGATGALLHTLESPNESQSGFFGCALAFSAGPTGGPELVVGAYGEARDEGGDPAGRVYVFAFPGIVAGGATAEAGAGLSVAVRPNPSAGAASVTLTVAQATSVRVAVLDALSRVVAVLHDGPLSSGSHRLALPAGLAAGVYAVVAEGAEVASARWVVAR